MPWLPTTTSTTGFPSEEAEVSHKGRGEVEVAGAIAACCWWGTRRINFPPLVGSVSTPVYRCVAVVFVVVVLVATSAEVSTLLLLLLLRTSHNALVLWK